MKKILLSISVLALAFGCSENKENPTRQSETFNFTASPLTRVSIDSNSGAITWIQNTDQIGIFSMAGTNGSGNYQYKADENGLTTSFSQVSTPVTTDMGPDFVAYYPYNGSQAAISGDILTCSVPAAQTATGQFGPNPHQSFMVAQATAVGTDVDFTFRNIFSLIRIRMPFVQPTSLTVTGFTLESTGGIPLAGTCEYDLTNDVITSVTQTSSSVSLTSAAGELIFINDDSVTYVEADIAILPVSTAGFSTLGLRLTVHTNTGQHVVNIPASSNRTEIKPNDYITYTTPNLNNGSFIP